MHERRLAFLAYKHARQVAVIARDERADGTYLTLACGHGGAVMASHFDARFTTHWRCSKCGEEYVRNSPIYVKEFLEKN